MRKFRADQIFTGFELLDDQHVLVTDDDGRIKEIAKLNDAGDDIQKLNGILSPGFVNCHCHLELSHMKNLIPEKTGLVDFVFKVVTERHHSDEEILSAIEKAENEMLENGIVAVGDICNNSLTISQKKKQRLNYYNFIEASGWLPAVSQIRFERAKILLDEFSAFNTKSSIVPHAPYSVSNDLWNELRPYFENKIVSIHNQETAFEDEFFLKGTGDFLRMYQLMKIDNLHHQPAGKSSLQSYFEKLSKAKRIILVHNTFTKQEDLDHIKLQTSPATHPDQLQTYICLCVNANKYIEDALPPIELFRRNNCSIVLGTDSLASNWSLNIWDEIKTIRRNFSLPIEEILQWATINGARALQMDGQLGSFEKGKRPGIVIINKDMTSSRLV